MKKILLLLLFQLLFLLNKQVYAANCGLTLSPGFPSDLDSVVNFKIEVDDITNNTTKYNLAFECRGQDYYINSISSSNNYINMALNKGDCPLEASSHYLELKRGNNSFICKLNYTIAAEKNKCGIQAEKPQYIISENIRIVADIKKVVDNFYIKVTGPSFNKVFSQNENPVNIPAGSLGQGTYNIALHRYDEWGNPAEFLCGGNFLVSSSGPTIPPQPTNTAIPTGCGGAEDIPSGPNSPLNKCLDCIGKGATDPKSGQYSWTALGCIPTDPNAFVNDLLPKVIGMAGGIAFLLMLWGAFTVLTSSGNPDKLNNGKEVIVSAIAGLLIILFSVFLLRLIGFDILKIPGFG